MPKLTAQRLIDAIEAGCQYDALSYSGRGMYGKRCVSVNLDNTADLLHLGALLGEELGVDSVPTPSIDSMGRGIVVYWPSIPLAGELGNDEDDDGDE